MEMGAEEVDMTPVVEEVVPESEAVVDAEVEETVMEQTCDVIPEVEVQEVGE